jgi:hypothetical protein
MTKITTIGRHERANPNSKNFGLGSRDIKQAAKNALQEKSNASQVGFTTASVQSNRFSQFADYLKDEHGIKDMRDIEKEHVAQYADELQTKFDCGAIGVKTAHDYLSAVNSVLSQAIGNNTLRVTASEAGLPNRSGITTDNKAISNERHEQVKNELPPHLSVIAEMQRQLGFRFEEAAKSNPSAMLQEATQKHAITISDGTKGGQSRVLPISSQSQIDALKSASVIQGQHNSMIPSHQSYIQFSREVYREHGKIGHQSHGERHAFAQNSYSNHMLNQTGTRDIKCPISSGHCRGEAHHQYIASKVGCTIQEAKAFDANARMLVAEELGHHRTDITNAYLG